MIRQEQIQEVLDIQNERFRNKPQQVERDTLSEVPRIESFATIITGIRRCGKSTLLLQVLKSRFTDALFLNFEDIRLVGFEASDFIRLQNEIDRRYINTLFFDEIQLIEKWEIFIHQLLDQGYNIFITGSNASLLSRELGTHLTGRNISMELFPFSYNEFLLCKNEKAGKDSLFDYLKTGGMPEYVKHQDRRILARLLEDLLIRDIAVRHKVRDVETLKKLAVYLLTNIGKAVSANNLKRLFSVKSTTTILEYFAHYSDSYLVEFLPQFNDSPKAQIRNPKKVYAIDTGFSDVVSTSSTEDLGRNFENLVYIHLRRKHSDLYYFKGEGECDFVIKEKNEITELIQVCYQINDHNFDREYNGLFEAMKFFNLKKGKIVTLNQADKFETDDFTIQVVPGHEYFID
ncbi:MAG: ATP-binding protein [Crocinitomicaceae bacterium]|nr:ATP-binding protein [Crocinitomicaceae bacterium]